MSGFSKLRPLQGDSFLTSKVLEPGAKKIKQVVIYSVSNNGGGFDVGNHIFEHYEKYYELIALKSS